MKKEKTGILKKIGIWATCLIPSAAALGGALYYAATNEIGRGIIAILSALGLTTIGSCIGAVNTGLWQLNNTYKPNTNTLNGEFTTKPTSKEFDNAEFDKGEDIPEDM